MAFPWTSVWIPLPGQIAVIVRPAASTSAGEETMPGSVPSRREAQAGLAAPGLALCLRTEPDLDALRCSTLRVA